MTEVGKVLLQLFHIFDAVVVHQYFNGLTRNFSHEKSGSPSLGQAETTVQLPHLLMNSPRWWENAEDLCLGTHFILFIQSKMICVHFLYWEMKLVWLCCCAGSVADRVSSFVKVKSVCGKQCRCSWGINGETCWRKKQKELLTYTPLSWLLH